MPSGAREDAETAAAVAGPGRLASASVRGEGEGSGNMVVVRDAADWKRPDNHEGGAHPPSAAIASMQLMSEHLETPVSLRILHGPLASFSAEGTAWHEEMPEWLTASFFCDL